MLTARPYTKSALLEPSWQQLSFPVCAWQKSTLTTDTNPELYYRAVSEQTELHLQTQLHQYFDDSKPTRALYLRAVSDLTPLTRQFFDVLRSQNEEQYQMKMSSPVTTRPSSSNTPNGHYQKITGVPCPATPTRYTAPVHIDVGGVIYTSSLETLTR